MERPRLWTPARPTGPNPGLTRRGVLGLGAAAASALIVPGCSRGRADEPAPSEAATFSTGNVGGVYYELGARLSELVSEVTGVELKPVGSDGSVDNIEKVAARKVDLGFCTSDSALGAYEGTGSSFTNTRLKFYALARVYDNYVHVVVPMASKASELAHLRPSGPGAAKKIVAVGPKDSGTEIVAQLILNTAKIDVTQVNMTLEQSIKALQLGKIHAFIWSGGVPTKPIATIQKTTGFRLLSLDGVAQTIALKNFGGYVVSSIPPSQYGLANSVPTLAIPNYLIAKSTLSDSWAWWTVNTLFRRQADLVGSGDPQDPKSHPEAGALDPRSAIATMPVPLHPAAERWYRQNHT